MKGYNWLYVIAVFFELLTILSQFRSFGLHGLAPVGLNFEDIVNENQLTLGKGYGKTGGVLYTSS